MTHILLCPKEKQGTVGYEVAHFWQGNDQLRTVIELRVTVPRTAVAITTVLTVSTRAALVAVAIAVLVV